MRHSPRIPFRQTQHYTHLSEVSLTEPCSVFGGLRMARVCAQPVFTYRHARARISDVDGVRSQMLYQRFRVTNTGNIIVM